MANIDSLGRSVKWQKRQVDHEREAIKLAAERAAEENDLNARLTFLTKQIRKHGEDTSALGQLRQFICIIFALVHHERKGGLSEKEVVHLEKIAHAILQTQGIQAKSSRLAFMHGELHLAMSQIYRKSGKQWLAAWEQQVGYYSAKSDPSGGKGFQALAMGNRALRLGNGSTALSLYTIAESSNPAPKLFERARLGRIVTLRMMGQLDDSFALVNDTMESHQITEPVKKEFLWEKALREVHVDGSMESVLSMVGPGGSHRDPGYLIEATLMSKVVMKREWLQSLPKVRYMARHMDLKPQKFGHLYKCALQLDDSYDYKIPMPVRISGLGEILSHTQLLISIGSELLVWAAAVRWLYRCQTHAVAALVLDEYRALSLRLSGGTNPDVLNLLQDIDSQSWLAELDRNQSE